MLLKDDDGRLKRKIIVLLCIIYIISNGSAIITSTSEVSSLQQNVTYLLTNASDQDTRIINLESVSSDFLIFNLTTITLIDGTLSDGSITSIEGYDDGISYNITEDSGANPLTFNMTFEGVTGFRSFGMRYNYQGGSGHEINVSLYDAIDDEYDMIFEITDTSGFVDTIIDLLQPERYITDETVNVRVTHEGNGIASHQFFVDRAVVGIFTVSTGLHDGMGQRENYASNHPVYAMNLTQHENDIFNLWLNATDQDTRIISNEAGIVSLWTNATGQDLHITNLWTNATDQDARIIINEDNITALLAYSFCGAGAYVDQINPFDCSIPAGGGGDRPPEWLTDNDEVTNNASIGMGNVNISGNTTFSIYTGGGTPIKGFKLWHQARALEIGFFGTGDLRLQSLTAEDTGLLLRTSDGHQAIIKKYNDTDVNDGAIQFKNNDPNGAIFFEPNNGNEIYFTSSSAGMNISATTEDIYFNHVGNWNTLHADAFTEHTNIYEGNESEAIDDVEKWVDGEHPLRLMPPESLFTNSSGDSYYIQSGGTDIGKAGKALVKYAKRNRNEGKRIRDRQYELISNLYDNGFLNQSQAINLRDNF